MSNLLFASAFFLGIHLLISGTTLRDRLVATLGEKPYLGLFSLASLGGLIWMVLAYRGLETDTMLWTAPSWIVHLGPIVMSLAFIFAIAGLSTPNPTAVQAEGLLEKEDAVKGVITVTRHPFQWSVVLWALYHLLANGQLSATILFGAIATLSLVGTFSIDKKRARNMGTAWEAFAAKSSNVPFAAMLQGRTQFDFRGIGWTRVLAGIVLYAVFVYFHEAWFGVSPMPGYLSS